MAIPDLREYIPEPSTVTAPLYSVCIEGVRLTCLDGMNGSLSAVSRFQSCWKFSSMIRKDSLKLFPLAAFTDNPVKIFLSEKRIVEEYSRPGDEHIANPVIIRCIVLV